MTLSNETIELIEKESQNFSVKPAEQYHFIQVVKYLINNPAILASVKGEEWVKKEDVAKVILWMCGYNDSEFPSRKENDPPYYWRSILRDKFEKIGVYAEKYLPTPPKTK